MEIPINKYDLGCPHFRKPPYSRRTKYSNPATRTMLNPRTPKSQCFSAPATKSDVRGLISFAHWGWCTSGYINIELWGVVTDRKGLNISSNYGTCRAPQLVLSRSLMFSHLLVSKLCCGNITLHAADLIPNCAKHCLFTSKCLLSASHPMFFLFCNSQLIPSCTKHSVSTGKCNLCASRPIFLFPNSQPISNCKKNVFSQVNAACVSRPIFSYSLIHNLFLFPNSWLIRLTWPCQWIMSFVTCCFLFKRKVSFYIRSRLMLFKLQSPLAGPRQTN